jgi:hypothetical protein
MATEPPRAPRDDEFWGQRERDRNWLGGKGWFK